MEHAVFVCRPPHCCPLHLLYHTLLHTAGGHGGNSGSSCPFATVGGDESKEQWQRANYHAKSQQKGMSDKVGSCLQGGHMHIPS